MQTVQKEKFQGKRSRLGFQGLVFGVQNSEKKYMNRFYSIFSFLNPPVNQISYSNLNDYLFVSDINSSKYRFTKESFWVGFFLLFFIAIVAYSARLLFSLSYVSFFSGSLAIFYFGLMSFKIFIVYKSLQSSLIDFSREEIEKIKDEELPLYTILIPLYREENVITQIINAMSKIDYPPEKLDIIITLEEYDHETIEAIRRASPPKHFKTLILPNVTPKTKPKALNVAFLNTKGEYLVIYDAEIIPDSDQLKKAYLAFKKYPDIACFQTRLDHYNTEQNLITKLFNAEFSFYYDLFLPGLQRMNFPIPLSGHSTHFRMDILRDIGVWDPYNVTEDCDMGMRLYRGGYKTAMLDSLSREEATSTIEGWIKQRTRWMKGFIQTSIVHLRFPLVFIKELGGWKKFGAFFFIVPATALINVTNLVYWFLFIGWIFTHNKMIQAFFPTPILYLSVSTFVFGNIVFTYLNLLGVYKRKKFKLVKYSILSPLYWILLAIATTRAFFHFVFKPHQWEKTIHGTHLK